MHGNNHIKRHLKVFCMLKEKQDDPSRASMKPQVVRKNSHQWQKKNHKQFPPLVGGAICSEPLGVEKIIRPDRNAKINK